MHKKFEINQTKIKGGCQSGRKMVTHNSKSGLPIVTVIFLQKIVVKVKRSGQIIDVTSLWEMEGGAVSVSSTDRTQDKFTFGRMDSIKA